MFRISMPFSPTVWRTLPRTGQQLAIPILNLFGPTYQAIEVGTNSYRGYKSLQEAIEASRKGKPEAVFLKAAFKTVVSAALAICYIVRFQAAFVTSCAIGLTEATYNLANAVYYKRSEEAFRQITKVLVNAGHIATQFLTGPQISLAAFFASSMADLWEGCLASEHHEQPKGIAYLSRCIIRIGMKYELLTSVLLRKIKG